MCRGVLFDGSVRVVVFGRAEDSGIRFVKLDEFRVGVVVLFFV